MIEQIKEFILSHVTESVVILVIVLFAVFRKGIIRFFRNRRKKEVVEEPIELEPEFFDITAKPYDISSSLVEQRKAAEQELRNIYAEGKQFKRDEKAFVNYINQQKILLNNRKQNLGCRYSTYSTLLNNTNQMIINQEKMDESLKREVFDKVREIGKR